MATHLTLLLSCWLAGAGAAQGPGLSGSYVNRQSPEYRVEFLSDGVCFLRDALGLSSGTYVVEDATYVCRRGETEVATFRVEDGGLIDQDGNEWGRREEVAALPWDDVRPVTMVILDSETREPVDEFSYAYQISTPTAKYDPLLVCPREVRSDKGEFTLVAPESCQIEMAVYGKSILGGYGTWRAYDLTSDNKLRRIEAFVRTGVTITGTVVDARTGKPIAGATVSPIVFAPPLFVPDERRAVKTDATGKFTINGVDRTLGIDASHIDYYDLNHRESKETRKEIGNRLYSTQIRLASGERLFGVVKDPAGKPLAGVTVSDGSGKEVSTAEDGSFALASLHKSGDERTYSLSLEKDGYLDRYLHPTSADPRGFSIVLQPVPVLAGEVLDLRGQPVNAFSVVAGMGAEPDEWSCSSVEVRDPTGRFSVPIRTDYDYGHTGKVWIGVKSEGFSPWDTTVPVGDLSRIVAVRLTPGVTVRGSVARPEAPAGDISATLLPVRLHRETFLSGASCRQELGRMETTVDAGGEFEFAHVGPGKYTLEIAGPTVSPTRAAVVISDADFDAGDFSLRGTGSVAGIVYKNSVVRGGGDSRLDENRGAWAFAKGSVVCHGNAETSEPLRSIPFTADEHGHFHVDGVSVGLVSVEIPYRLTADMIGTHVRKALVVEGETTDVRFFDTSGEWEVACEFQIGDGSSARFSSGTGMGARRKVDNVTTRAPMFEIELHPIGHTPASYDAPDATELDSENRILLRDVHPGKYRVSVNDWQGIRGVGGNVYETTVETKRLSQNPSPPAPLSASGARGEGIAIGSKTGTTTLTVPLGAGSITGGLLSSKGSCYLVRVIAVGKRIGVVRYARCDERGYFCVRYLPSDDYTLWAHDVDAGWCTMPTVSVRDNIHDLGIRRLATGGTVTATVPAQWQGDPAVTIVAVDSRGIVIGDPDGHASIGERFTVSNLWPGTWTLRTLRGDEVVAEKAVVLKGREKVSCDLGSP